jgi:hypothetical protein
MNEFTVEKIGLIDHGCDGSSEYLLVTNPDDETTPDQVIDFLLPLYYRDTQTPGAYFCHTITATHYPHSLSKVIAVVHHQYNN